MSSVERLQRSVGAGLRETLLLSFGRTYAHDFRAALRDTQPFAYVEIAVGLGVLALLNLLFFRVDNWGYFDSNPHPFWLIVIPIAARYGALPGYAAGFASAALYFLFILLQPRSAFVVDVFSSQAILNPVLFIIAGGALGELREAQKRAHKALAERYDEVEAGLQDIAQRYLAAVEINHEMQRRIVTQTSTVTTLYQAAKRLEELDVEELAPAALELVTSFIEADACALYLRQDGRFVLKAALPAGDRVPRPTELDTTRGLLAIAVGARRTVTVRDVIAEATPAEIMSQPLLMATPLAGQDGEVIGLLTVERIPFLRFTPTAVKLFGLLGDWASTAFQTALRFQETRDRNVQDELTGAYSYAYTWKRLGDELERARRYGFPLAVAAVRVERYAAIAPVRVPSVLQTLGLVFRQHIRPFDLLGKSATDDVFLLVLPHLAPAEAEALAGRLREEIVRFGFRPYDDDATLDVRVGLASTADAAPYGSSADGSAAVLPPLGPRELLDRALRSLAEQPPAALTRGDAVR